MGSSHLERFSLGALGHPMHLANEQWEPEGQQLKKLLATLPQWLIFKNLKKQTYKKKTRKPGVGRQAGGQTRIHADRISNFQIVAKYSTY
jgi:hypothetical protein